MKSIYTKALPLALLSLAVSANAAEKEEKELQDMSDPLAVFSQAGVGYTDRGLNLKYGESYDTGSATTMGMNVIEIKGIGGEAIGFSDTVEPDNSIDSFRFRNFEVDLTTGRGAQIDMSYDVETESANASYSFMQALPKWGRIQLYPIAGIGVNIQNNAVDNIVGDVREIDEGYSIPGVYGVVGMYSKLTITDKIWANYNPMYLTSIAGSDHYQNNTYGLGNDDILLHEVAVSYQLSPRANVRYFANFTDEIDFKDGEHRIEFNYQF